MPTYEYECAACGHQFEISQSINDPALTQCPRCDGNIKRLISGGSGFIMKSAVCPGSAKCRSFTENSPACCRAGQGCGLSPCGD
ncbi:MAG: FmdB family zinc ribbon protein [Smithellaceae bacterium]